MTDLNLHPLFGELFDRVFPVIAAPRPLTPTPSDLPELSAEQLAEGDECEARR